MHIADVSWFVPAGSPLDHGAAERALSTYVPGLVAPMLPHELADDACSLRPHQDRLCVTVEMPPAGEPVFYRSVISSRARLTYGQAERREAPAEIVEQLDLAAEVARALRAARYARGALEVTSPEIAFSFADGRVAAAWRESEPHAHMLVEELMIRANEHVAAFLAGRRRAALYRVHEPPDPLSIERLVAQLADLDVPTPPMPERVSPGTGGRARRRDLPPRRRVRRAVGAGEGGVPDARAARAQAGALRPGEPRPLRPREPRPTATSPRRSGATPTWSSTGRSSTSSASATTRVPDDLAELAEHTSAREREAAQVEYLADDICLAWLLEDSCSSAAGTSRGRARSPA